MKKIFFCLLLVFISGSFAQTEVEVKIKEVLINNKADGGEYAGRLVSYSGCGGNSCYLKIYNDSRKKAMLAVAMSAFYLEKKVRVTYTGGGKIEKIVMVQD